MANLLRSELIQSQTVKPDTQTGNGEYVLNKDQSCLCLLPNHFYANSAYVSIIPPELFQENTAYILNLWIDRSAYDSSKSGIRIDYTDGSYDISLDKKPDTTVDFEHHIIITPSTKTIDKIDVIYHTNKALYLRWDSFITEVKNTPSILRSGVLKLNNYLETTNQQASLGKEGVLYCNNFYEY